MDAFGPMGGGRGADSGAAGPIVLACAATGIVEYIERLGGDIDRIFGHAGLAPAMAGSPTLGLRLASYCALFEEASRLTKAGNFGLWFGNQFKPRSLGLWGYAAVSSPTLGSALENLVGLFPHHQESSAMRLRQGGDGLMRLEYQIESPRIVERRQDAELSLGMFLNLLREGCGADWAPEEVHFEHPAPENGREHESAFGAPVYFSQGTNALLFRPEVLRRPMPARDLTLMAVARSALEQLSRVAAAPASIVDRMRHILRTRLSEGYPALEQIAAELRLSTGAVQRELQQEGLAYKDLVEEVRRDLAFAYMRQRQLPLSEIAFLLGYSELSAFSRAVRRWTGESPRRVRARLAGH
jgi:AraC-like DNA-binding protein